MMADEVKGKPLAYYGKNIYTDSGFKGFYKGLDSNIARGIVLNSTKVIKYNIIIQLGVYSSCKTFVKKVFGVKDGLLL